MKRQLRIWFVFLSAVLWAISASVVRAQENVWRSIGPEGAKISALAVDPKSPATLYAGTYESGIFKSADSGENWTAMNNGLTFTPLFAGANGITALAMDPQTPATLYASAGDNGVFKSVDGGESWSAINNGLIDPDHIAGILSLAIDPQTPTTLYAGTFNGIVFKSVDGGGSWNRTRSSSMAGDVRAIVIDPMTPTTVYAASNYLVSFDDEGAVNLNLGGIAKSENGGRRWAAADGGLPPDYIWSLAIDPDVPTILYAGTGWGDVRGNVFKSTDGGATWSSPTSGLSGSVRAVVVDPRAHTTLYAGTTQGVFRSVDSGNSWSALSDGLSDLDVTTLALSPSTPTTVYAGTAHSGVFSIQLHLKIIGASVIGKRLFVLGDGFDSGAVVLLNGEVQRTKNDSESLAAKLVAKKAGKKIAPGQSVTLQVLNSDATLSPEFIFTRPVE